MKLIKPSYIILDQKLGLDGIYEQIELAGRTCYKSKRPEGQTAKDFVDRMIASQHYAMLEHGTVYLKFIEYYNTDNVPLKKYLNNPYSKVVKGASGGNFTDDYTTWFVTTNYRVLVENDWLDDLKYLCEPTEFHEKRVTVRFTTSNGIMREFTRHRTMSFAVESTRYCNYSKDKFNNELTFIAPSWMDEISFENVQNYLHGEEYNISFGSENLINALAQCESCYLSMIKSGMKPQEAREVLPLATKCDMVMTGFVSDYQHFFDLRARETTGKAHPDAKALAEPLMNEFINRGYIKDK